jgi:acyl-CoA synthetase (AMP-forming)/AMP-acid ligase II
MINKKPESVGIPMPNLEVWIEDEDGTRLPPDSVGELVVRGPSVMQCYWNDPESTDKVLRPGRYQWEKVLYTGDLFKMDSDGFLYFVARKDDLIKSRGERISPKEIENVLYAMDEVLHARVIGVPHEIFGSLIKAEIVLKEDCQLDKKEIIAYCKRHLEDIMVPQEIEFVNELPVSSSGKIKRKADSNEIQRYTSSD